MPVLHFVSPGDLNTRTGGFGYDRRIIAGLRDLGWRIQVLDAGDATAAGSTGIACLAPGALLVVDGLAAVTMPDDWAKHAARLRVVALVHHPLALENGLTEGEAARLRQRERVLLDAARRVIVTSETTRSLLLDDGIAPRAVAVVRPGTNPAPPARTNVNGTIELLCVATLTPRKGHAVLFDALSRLRDLPWRLTCVGALDRAPDTVAALHAQVRRLNLTTRIEFAGVLDDDALERTYRDADLFVLASYFEGYGMALGEALAHGIPIVSTRAGAIPETVPEAAGLLVAPGEAAALSEALARVIEDAAQRAALARGSRAAGRRLPTWEEAVRRFDAELRQVPASP